MLVTNLTAGPIGIDGNYTLAANAVGVEIPDTPDLYNRVRHLAAKGLVSATGASMNASEIKNDSGDPISVSDLGSYATTRVVIAAGATGLSEVIDLGGFQLAAIQMPAVWTAANLTAQAADAADGTFQNVYDDVGSEVVITAAAARCITVNYQAMNLAPLRFIKFRSGTAATPVDQLAERTLTLILKR